MSATGVEWILAAVDDDLANAWREFCSDLAGVRVHHGSILDAGCDAVVSPANSSGYMRGGIDAVYARTFAGIESRVRAQIAEHHGGELAVGSADIVETGHEAIPFLIAAPTMPVPMVLPADTQNPYLAARAVFRLVLEGSFADGEPVASRVKSVALPGLGTGVGGVSFAICALQVRLAYQEAVLGA